MDRYPGHILPVTPDVIVSGIAERVRVGVAKALAVGALIVAGVFGSAEAVDPGTLPEQPAVVQEGPAQAPSAVQIRPAEVSVQPPDQQLELEPAHFTIYPVTLDAPGFQAVKESNKDMIADTQVGWQEVTTAANGALPLQAEVEVKPAQKVRFEGLTNVTDFCNKKIPNFRNLLRDAVLPDNAKNDATNTPIIVIDQKRSNPCFTADGGVGVGIVVYNPRTYFTGYVMAHEIAHTRGVSHSNTLGASATSNSVGCARPVSMISLNCHSKEYGDNYTDMGGFRYKLGDPDPFNGVSLKRLGAIKPYEITEVGFGESTCQIAPLSDKTGQTRLARIPIVPTEVTVDPDKKAGIEKGVTSTISSIYFELSTNYTDTNKSRELSLKIIGANDYAPNEMTPTFLIPVNGKQSFTAKDIGKKFTFEIGNRKISFTLESIPNSKDMFPRANVALNVEDLEPEYISGA